MGGVFVGFNRIPPLIPMMAPSTKLNPKVNNSVMNYCSICDIILSIYDINDSQNVAYRTINVVYGKSLPRLRWGKSLLIYKKWYLYNDYKEIWDGLSAPQIVFSAMIDAYFWTPEKRKAQLTLGFSGISLQIKTIGGKPISKATMNIISEKTNKITRLNVFLFLFTLPYCCKS